MLLLKHFKKEKPMTNSDRVFQQWLEIVKEDAETWVNPLYKNSLVR